MDIELRKYIQYKIRNQNKRKLELLNLKAEREKERQDILETISTPNMDGMPHAKGSVGDPTQSRAIKLEEIDRRIEKLEKEIADFENIEKKIHLMGRIPEDVYKQTIVKNMNAEYVAMQNDISRRSLFNVKSALLKFIARELGEYLDLEEERKHGGNDFDM
jgi:hypothetical protein